ncbi:MAG: RagB/SusD family nutrient uptake outer membrane protein [Marinilabiliales bacterium]|nr:MAG: RagB/SusD family nutrient uptake outer membrane protein [Marinilabiliales bacterium]
MVIMRYTVTGIPAILIAAALFSCSEEFLHKEPQGITAETVFKNEKGIEALLLGTYGIISGGALWEVSWGASIQNWTYGSVASDDAYKGSEFNDQLEINEIERWNVSPDNPYPAEKWKWAFGMGVYRANEVLRIIGLTEDLKPAAEARLRAEARFLRAFYNLEAWLVFGNIPIITEDAPDPAEVTNINPEGAVLEHIIGDLKYAAANLPEVQSEVGRPTRYAAKALAAKAYMQELMYAEAKPLLDAVINSGRYELMPNFFDNYRIVHNNNPESIFEIQANVSDGACCFGNAEMGIGLNFPHGADIGTCCGFHQPSQNLVNAFRVDERGLPMFESFNDTDLKNDMGIPSAETFVPFEDEVDPRLDRTVSRRGIPYRDWGINRGRDWIRDQDFGGPYLPASKPFIYQHERPWHGTTWMPAANPNNYRYLRLGHVLLWRAEVAAYEGDLTRARLYVNMVRERAENEVVMGRVQIHELPPGVYPWGPGTTRRDHLTGGSVDWNVPAANYNVGLYDEPFGGRAEAMRAVQWELRLEFATEGHRFFDLRRWDNLPPELNSMPMAETLNSFAEADTRIRDFMNGAAFIPERDKYQPIPQSQIDMQPGVLVQNPGY